MGHIIDVMATCVDISGAKYPATKNDQAVFPYEGNSLLPTFQHPETTKSRMLCWEHEGNKAIRQGDWKLVKENGHKWELYDLSQDRSELHDLVKSEPQRVETMSREWDAWAERVGVVPWDDLPPPGYRSKGPDFYRKK